MKEGRKPEDPEYTPDDELQNMPHTKAREEVQLVIVQRHVAMATAGPGKPVYADVGVVHAVLKGLEQLEIAEDRLSTLKQQVWRDGPCCHAVVAEADIEEARAEIGRRNASWSACRIGPRCVECVYVRVRERQGGEGGERGEGGREGVRRRLVSLAKRSQMCRVCICKSKRERGEGGGREGVRRRLVSLAKRSQMCRVCICKSKGETGGRGGGERREGGREGVRRRLVSLAKRSQMCRVCICKSKRERGEGGGRGGREGVRRRLVSLAKRSQMWTTLLPAFSNWPAPCFVCVSE